MNTRDSEVSASEEQTFFSKVRGFFAALGSTLANFFFRPLGFLRSLFMRGSSTKAAEGSAAEVAPTETAAARKHQQTATEVKSKATVSGAPQSSAMSSTKDAKRPIAIVRPSKGSMILRQYGEAVDKITTQDRALMVGANAVLILIKGPLIRLNLSTGLNLYYLLIINEQVRMMHDAIATPEDQQQVSDIMKKCKSAISADFPTSFWKSNVFDYLRLSEPTKSALIKGFAALEDSVILSELGKNPDILAHHQELSALVGADQRVLDIIKKAAVEVVAPTEATAAREHQQTAAEVESEPTVSGAPRMSSADVSAASFDEEGPRR